MPVAELRVEVARAVTEGGEASAPSAVAPVAPVAAAPSSGGDLLGDLLGGPSTAPSAPSGGGGGGLNDLLGLDLGGSSAPAAAPSGGSTGGGDLMDLLGMGMGAPAAAPPPAAAPSGGLGDLGDLLGGGMGGGPTPAPAANGGGLGGLADLLGGPTATPAAPAGGIPSIIGWEKNGLSVKFDFSKNPANPNVLQIMLTATNSTPQPMANFSFQIAVPKTHQLQMQQQSASGIPPNNSGAVTTPVLVNNPQKIPIRMRVKVMYDTPAGHVEEMGEIANFPPNAL